MKIIQVISQLGNGGAEKLVVELSNELEKDNQVVLISFRKIKEWMYFPRKLKKSIKLMELNKKEGFDISIVFKLIKIVREERPDIIHIHLDSTLRYLMLLMPFFKKIRFVYTLHSSFEPFKKQFNLYSKIWFFKNIYFICLSEEIYNDFKESFPSLNFRIINNGIADLKITKKSFLVKKEIEGYKNNSNSNSNTFIFLYVGRLSYEKNIPLLVDVFFKIAKKNLKLLVIGKDTSENQDDFRLIEQYKKDNIIYLGAKENVQDYMKYVNALILTSRYEGLPLVVLEALSVGLPIISTPVGSLVDTIKNGKNGFLSDEISSRSILNIIDRFLNLTDREIEQIRSNNIDLFNQKYSIEHCGNSYSLCYQNI